LNFENSICNFLGQVEKDRGAPAIDFGPLYMFSHFIGGPMQRKEVNLLVTGLSEIPRIREHFEDKISKENIRLLLNPYLLILT